MPLRTFVKVGNITHLSDARYCAGMGVDMLGFVVDPALPGYLAPEAFRAITDWVSGVLLAGEVRSWDGAVPQGYPLHYVEAREVPPVPPPGGLPLILRVDWDEVCTAAAFFARMAPARLHAAYFLLESGSDAPLSGAVAAELQAVAEQFPVLLGFGIHKGSVLGLLETIRPAGIALQGAPEIRPGYKDFEELAGILELLETD